MLTNEKISGNAAGVQVKNWLWWLKISKFTSTRGYRFGATYLLLARHEDELKENQSSSSQITTFEHNNILSDDDSNPTFLAFQMHFNHSNNILPVPFPTRAND